MTRSQLFPSSPSYQAVIRGLLRMHRLALAGQHESEEAETLRESMNTPWEALSNFERERVTSLSKDLYEISNQTAQPPEPMTPEAQAKLSEAHEARERGDWDRALELLRRWGKYVTPALLCYLRGTIWRAAGDAATAAVFFEHAFQLDPASENFQAVLLDTLKTADPQDAANRADAVLQNSDTSPLSVVVYAADIIFGTVRRMSDAEATPTYQRLIPILERTLTRLEKREDVGSPALIGMVLGILAACCRELGDTRKAYACYSRAIQLDPTNDTLLVARGALVYGTDPNAAADFEQAIRLGSPLVWPYFYLAHHYLATNRFEECRFTSEQALQRPASNRVQSELCEFLAISLTGLSYPEPVIRRAFENAIRVDPFNERARRNLEKFETALASRAPRPRNWEKRSESSLRAFAQQESASSQAAPSGPRTLVNV